MDDDIRRNTSLDYPLAVVRHDSFDQKTVLQVPRVLTVNGYRQKIRFDSTVLPSEELAGNGVLENRC